MSVLKESNSDPQVVKPLYERLNKAMLEYLVPESKGIQNSFGFFAYAQSTRRLREDFMDTSLMEEIRKSGFIDRLYGRAS